MPNPMVDVLRDDRPPAVLQPTPRNPLMGLLADALRGARGVANELTFNPDLPLVGGQSLGDLVMGKMPEEIDDWSYGNSPIQVNPYAGQTGSFVPEVKRNRKESLGDTILAAQGVPGGNKMLLGAVAGGMAPGPADAAAFLAHTPTKPNPLVGTRFKREHLGGMAEKKPVKIEDVEGASLGPMPWDLTNRNYKITSISDEPLATPIITSGGQDFARDLENIAAGRAGASNKAIANRIRDRNETARQENLAAGGSGDVYMLPSTMGPESEFFSTMPSDVMVQLLRNANLGSKDLKFLSDKVRNAPGPTGTAADRPFGDFAGFGDPDFESQLVTGLGPGASAGELRKAVMRQLSQTKPQQMIGYNREDLANALTDPALQGLDKGYVGNTAIKATEGTPFMESLHPSYDTGFGGQYAGSFGHNIPIEVMMPKAYRQIQQEFETKGIKATPAQMRNAVIRAMETRGSGFTELVDKETIDSVNRWLDQYGAR